MNAPVSVPKDFNSQNEHAFRQHVDGEFAMMYRKDGHVIIPFGKYLGFAGSTGKLVTFDLDGSDNFTISIDGAPAVVLATSGDVDDVETKLEDAYAFVLDVSNRAIGFKSLADGSLGPINFIGSEVNFYDGVSDRPLVNAAGGIFTVNGDVAVSSSIFVGAARLKVALESLEFLKGDGETIQWAGGTSIGNVPKYLLDVSACNPLTAGEQYDVRLTGVTNTGATLYAKITTPGVTASQSETTDAAGGGGAPDRVMEKPTAADAYNGVYPFTISGTVNVVGYPDSGFYLMIGTGTYSTWFNDGGGWDEGPPIVVEFYYFSVTDDTGALPFTQTFDVAWDQAIGQHGGYEFGVSHESGGSLTSIDEIAYTTQTSSGTRSATPSGEKVKVTVFPRNAA